MCKEKPAYQVTLRDVVRECGISQGGIYRYFTDIDELFAGVLNRYYEEVAFGADIDTLFAHDKSCEQVISDALATFGRHMDKTISLYGTLVYELSVIYLADKQRGDKVEGLLTEGRDSNRLFENVFAYLDHETSIGNMKPRMPLEDIKSIIVLAAQGAVRSLTFSPCPGGGVEMMQKLAQTVMITLT